MARAQKATSTTKTAKASSSTTTAASSTRKAATTTTATKPAPAKKSASTTKAAPAKKSASTTKAAAGSGGVFTAEERAAMKSHAAEVRAQRRLKPGQDDEASVLAAIEALPQPDRGLAEQVHRVVRATAPGLTCRLWYGFPAYAKDGKIAVFFQYASKFKSRYSTLGFNDVATLDDGAMWPVAYAVTAVGPKEEKAIAALVRKAVG